MKKLIVLLLLLAPIVSLELQQLISFYDQVFHKDHIDTSSPKTHFSQIAEENLPINLNQYISDVVIRVDYSKSANMKKELLMLSRSSSSIPLKIWGKSNTENYIDIQLSENSLLSLKNQFTELQFKTIIEDLPQSIYESYPTSKFTTTSNLSNRFTEEAFSMMNELKADPTSDIFFKDFRPLETIYSWLDLLEETYPQLVKIEWIGQTYEGRDYKAVHVSTNNDLNIDKKTIIVTGGVHAREWVSISSVCYILFNLLTNYGTSRKETRFLDELDFLFIPIANPDGYEYTWTHDRLWRKNRQETYLPRCFGIDIDHSFDYHFQHSDDSPCGEEYSGETPFEAIEAEIWNHYLNETKSEHKIYGYIDLHSYAQEILYPYAYSCDQYPRDSENLMELAYGLSKAIRLKSGKHYDVLAACKDRDSDLLPALGSGTALDYMYHNRADWAFQIKLRDSGSHGFLLPNKYIVPVGKEIYSSIKYFCSFILKND